MDRQKIYEDAKIQPYDSLEVESEDVIEQIVDIAVEETIKQIREDLEEYFASQDKEESCLCETTAKFAIARVRYLEHAEKE